MNFQVSEIDRTEDVVKRACYLAWQSSNEPTGMGTLRDNPGASEDDVWKNIAGREDYPPSSHREQDIYADYVFGRMMKLRVKIDKDKIFVDDPELKPDYQSWCVGYATYQELLEKAAEELGLTIKSV